MILWIQFVIPIVAALIGAGASIYNGIANRNAAQAQADAANEQAQTEAENANRQAEQDRATAERNFVRNEQAIQEFLDFESTGLMQQIAREFTNAQGVQSLRANARGIAQGDVGQAANNNLLLNALVSQATAISNQEQARSQAGLNAVINTQIPFTSANVRAPNYSAQQRANVGNAAFQSGFASTFLPFLPTLLEYIPDFSPTSATSNTGIAQYQTGGAAGGGGGSSLALPTID